MFTKWWVSTKAQSAQQQKGTARTSFYNYSSSTTTNIPSTNISLQLTLAS